MHIVGRSTSSLEVAYTHVLGHGEDPYRAAGQRGFVVQRALSTRREGADIVLELMVTEAGPDDVAPRPHRARALDPQAPRTTDEPPIARQRIAAYTIVVSSRGVLATQFSHRTGASGQWGLPGGGVEADEEPDVTVVREAYEETGQRLLDPVLLDVQSDHWIGRSPSGLLEDFHAVRLVFTGRVDDPIDTVVYDVDGTTADARWVPLDTWRELAWTGGARTLLERHLENCVTGFAVRPQPG